MVAEDFSNTGYVCAFVVWFLVRWGGGGLVGGFQDGKEGGIGYSKKADGVVFWCDCW